MKVIFMGTPEFSCPTLQKLIDNKKIDILAAYSKEPSRSGRGKKLKNSPIHNLAFANEIRVLTPKTLKNPEIKKEFLDFNCDLVVVVAYGLILPSEIINSPKFGCINLHPSFLPKWRGAAPIERSIMNGDKITATTIIKMNEGLDSGDIIKQEIFELGDKISYQELANKFAYDGANLILQTIEELKTGEAKFTKQAEEEVIYAKKIEKSEALLDFSRSSTEVYNKIRALSGNIGAYFIYEDQRVKILEAKIIDYNNKNECFGKISDENMEITCKIGIIKPVFLQKPGKIPVSVSEFLRSKRN